MASFSHPIASSIGDVEFGRLSADEIKRISVKKIHNAPTLDSFNNPVPGGLYDPALGAWGDHICTTCRLNAWNCAGHPGHIELPIPCYHPSFLDQALRLLKAQCAYCHRLRMSRVQLNLYTCKLKLLQYGLIEELGTLEDMHMTTSFSSVAQRGTDKSDGADSDAEEEEDPDDFMDRRNTFVRNSIRNARKIYGFAGDDIPHSSIAAAKRKDVIKQFMLDIASVKKCAACKGISPSYRKDRNSKIFRQVLLEKHRLAMAQAGLRAPNPFLFLQELQKTKKSFEKHSVNGRNHRNETQVNGYGSDDLEIHGAEEEVATSNAIVDEAATVESGKADTKAETPTYVSSSEVRAALELLFQREKEIFNLIYDSRIQRKGAPGVSPDMFFITNVFVPPNKFRPVAQQGAREVLEAQQNAGLNRIIRACDAVLLIRKEMLGGENEFGNRRRGYRDLLYASVQLQEEVNNLIDQPQNPAARLNDSGIKQRLEKKEGLFRKNMMGKRVNFAARSVISPDPNIETNEIGIPLVFAKKLTYPEPVTNHNFWELKQAVIHGPDKYPGASAVENEVGQVVSLRYKNLDERTAIANLLLTPSRQGLKGGKNKKVYRHLMTGDIVIMNRQPTLHKPSMMAHRARVLPGEKTIRMHYANCNTYNADFDGDEMNLHFPQNEIARAEAYQIADTDHQYLSATAGKPLRGLIQDHISMGVQFTSRDALFTKDQYQQLLYSCIRPEQFHIDGDRIEMVPPAILRPRPMWTGKQVITTVLKNIQPKNRTGLNMDGKSSTPGERWGAESEEQTVIFRDGELLCGILDKAQLGPTAGGFIHSIYEIYGHQIAGKLLGILGRLLTRFLQMRAWTCGMDDLRLNAKGDRERRKNLARAKAIGLETALEYVTIDAAMPMDEKRRELLYRLEEVLRDEEKQIGLDKKFNGRTAALSSEITAACLPTGLEKSFPWNQMQAMTISGAKGSLVNANQISCNLGQQVLEGRRVPVMISGKTLPSFKPFETDLSAGGYVSGRFLTGVKPQEYYFHAMAGREGLIDTAVKTAKSGYLQRCLVKGLEGLKTEYDTSVREVSDGSILQFLYGEDGLDISKQKRLQEFGFLAKNHLSVMAQVNISEDWHKLYNDAPSDWHKAAMKAVRKTGKLDGMDPALAHFHPGAYLGSTSEAFTTALKKYEEENPDKLIKDKKQKIDGIVSKRTFEGIMEMKYMNSVVDPGETVGIVAAQSVGEPSTQMTLNTFHLAGHAAKNVTLGIPRLREIVMTASVNISTPTMTLHLNPEITEEDGKRFAKGISLLSLAEVIDKLQIEEHLGDNAGYAKARIYKIKIQLFSKEDYESQYAITAGDLSSSIEAKFIPRLEKAIAAEIRKKVREGALSSHTAAVPDIGVSVGHIEEDTGHHAAEREVGDEDEDDDDDPEAAKQNRRQRESYEEPDEEEQAIVDRMDEDDELDDVSNASDTEGTPRKGKKSKRRDGSQSDSGSAESDSEDEDEGARDREEALKNKHNHLSKYRLSQNHSSCHLEFTYDASTPKFLLLPILEKVARESVIQSIPGLKTCTYGEEKTRDPVTGEEGAEGIITTEGVNLLAMRDYQDVIAPHSLYSNSIHHMLMMYGVEAARGAVVREVDAVFRGHSIAVDNRHLNLIADVMTQSGGYRAFNRLGVVRDGGSAFAKMSFETVMGFLKESVLEREGDALKGPSARLVVGKRTGVGTGAVDVLVPVSATA